MLCQYAGYVSQAQPPLFFWSLVVCVDHTLKILHVMKLDVSVLHTHKTDLGSALRTFLNQCLHTQAGEAVGLNAVEWRRVATLL